MKVNIMSNQDEIKEILEEVGEKGISVNDLMKRLNKTKTAIFDAIHRVKVKGEQKGYKIDNDNGFYILRKQSLRNEPHKEKILSILKAVGEDGLSTGDLAAELNTTKDVIYDTINRLRKDKYHITNKNGIYILNGQTPKTSKKSILIKKFRKIKAIVKNNSDSSTVQRNSNSKEVDVNKLSPILEPVLKHFLSKTNLIIETKKKDYLDLIEKGAEYFGFAENMLKVHQIITNYMETENESRRN